MMSLYSYNVPRCQHIKVNGTQCGSPALKRSKFCFFHRKWQETRIAINANRARRARASIDLPVLEDANSIQISLMQVMRLVASGQIDPKTAGLLLYVLQTASNNLGRTDFDPRPRQVVIDPKTVDESCLGENLWENEDLDDEDGDGKECDSEEDCSDQPGDQGKDDEKFEDHDASAVQKAMKSVSPPGEKQVKSEQPAPQKQPEQLDNYEYMKRFYRFYWKDTRSPPTE